MECKSKLYSLYSVLLAFVLLLSPMSSIGSLASTTSGSEIENAFEYTEQYVQKNFDALCRYVVKQNAIISSAIIGTWENFTSWLDSSGNGDIWEQHPHSPIRTNGDVVVSDEVLNVLNQYVIYQIQQNPLTYTECVINSINFVDRSQFMSYSQYASVMSLAEQNKGCWIFLRRSYSHPNYIYRIAIVPVNGQMFFYGTQTGGIFNNVNVGYDWVQNNVPWRSISGSKQYQVQPNGSITEVAVGTDNYVSAQGVMNTTSVYYTEHGSTVFTTNSKSEYIYLFNNINAFKNFNSGSPQPYYLTSDGLSNSMSNWSVGSGTINTGTLSNANSSYNSVVNNVQSGWTAEEVLQLVNMISNNNGFGSGGSGSDDDSDGWLDLGIFGDIGKAIAKVFGAIISAIASIFEEIITIVTNVSETLLQGVIFDFLTALLGWLPEEIIAVITALFSIAVLFALIKLIREAF